MNLYFLLLTSSAILLTGVFNEYFFVDAGVIPMMEKVGEQKIISTDHQISVREADEEKEAGGDVKAEGGEGDEKPEEAKKGKEEEKEGEKKGEKEPAGDKKGGKPKKDDKKKPDKGDKKPIQEKIKEGFEKFKNVSILSSYGK